jgi:hypothetical protein
VPTHVRDDERLPIQAIPIAPAMAPERVPMLAGRHAERLVHRAGRRAFEDCVADAPRSEREAGGDRHRRMIASPHVQAAAWCMMRPVRLGIADHFGWAVAVVATADHRVADRRRVELIGPDLPAAPVHHVGGPHLLHRAGAPLDDDALAALVAKVRASVVQASAAALDELADASPEPIVSISLRTWPTDFPTDIAVQRRAPYESRADAIMYRDVLAELAHERGWQVHLFAKSVEDDATSILGDRAHDVLHGPRAELGAPWSKDHRMALAATVVAAEALSDRPRSRPAPAARRRPRSAPSSA